MVKKVKDILVLCTGNSCRSQMAEGYLRFFAEGKANVYSAGIETHGVNPRAIAVMLEDGIDISGHTSNNVNEYGDVDFDLILTVCNNAEANCPYFPSKALRFHYNFPDPAKATGAEEEILKEFRATRDLIKLYCQKFLKIHLTSNGKSFENFKMYTIIKKYCETLIPSFDSIPNERKEILQKLADYIQSKIDLKEEIKLVYVCTHNSRRSHFGQVWAAVAASFYSIQNVTTYSGGTEATAFNINAISSLRRIGFQFTDDNSIINPVYKVNFSETEYSTCFSKVYDDKENPSTSFAAIMTCSDAEQNCPFIPGVELRIGTTYNDPKEFDNTPLQDAKYDERCEQIALETLYVFSKLKTC